MSEAKKVEEMARKIWLAGLGAYGQGLDNIEQGYEKMNSQTRKIFDDLVARGEHLEKDVKAAGKKLKNKGKKLTGKQATKLAARLGKVSAPEFVNEQIRDIRARLNDLSVAVGQVLTARKAPSEVQPTSVNKPKTVKAANSSSAPKRAPKKPVTKSAGEKEKAGTAAPTEKRKATAKKAAPKAAKAPGRVLKKAAEQPEQEAS